MNTFVSIKICTILLLCNIVSAHVEVLPTNDKRTSVDRSVKIEKGHDNLSSLADLIQANSSITFYTPKIIYHPVTQISNKSKSRGLWGKIRTFLNLSPQTESGYKGQINQVNFS